MVVSLQWTGEDSFAKSLTVAIATAQKMWLTDEVANDSWIWILHAVLSTSPPNDAAVAELIVPSLAAKLIDDISLYVHAPIVVP